MGMTFGRLKGGEIPLKISQSFLLRNDKKIASLHSQRRLHDIMSSMPTKYILHGGLAENTVFKQDFYDEIIRDLPKKKIQILYVPFAKEKNKWQDAYQKHIEQFAKAFPRKEIEVILADENSETFLDQTHTADIIYLSGGNTVNILEVLQKIPQDILINHLNDKVVVGSSAGVNVLSKYYYSAHRQQIEEGLGILPIKVFCHYTEEKEPKLEELEAYREHLTSFALPEDYFVIIQ
jgi:peptidase E